jgi:succinoglycan biosynthesis protein ExoA
VNQDYEFDWRVRQAGYRLLFDPALAIDWECRQSVAELFDQYRRYGKGKANVASIHPRSLQPRHLAAPALVAGLAAALGLLASGRPKAAAVLAAPYTAALVAATASVTPRVEREARPFVAPAFAAMHVGWGLGFWHGCASVMRERWTNRRSTQLPAGKDQPRPT